MAFVFHHESSRGSAPASAAASASASALADDSDEALFARVRDHADEQAFRVLYRRYDKRLYGYCLRAFGNRSDADDVFQAVMALVFEKRALFSGGSFAAWLFTIARRQTLNLKQKYSNQQKNTTAIDDVEFSLADTSDTTGADVVLGDAFRKAIAALPEEFREPLEMKHFDGFAYEDIAQTLGISVSLAKVRVFRAKKMLQTALEPYLRDIEAANKADYDSD
jgi:RNA polymerase sigma-70 factor, ECF subfamily